MIQNVTELVVLHESWCRLFGLVLVLFRAQKIDKGLRLQDMFQAFLSAVLALGAVAEHATAPGFSRRKEAGLVCLQ